MLAKLMREGFVNIVREACSTLHVAEARAVQGHVQACVQSGLLSFVSLSSGAGEADDGAKFHAAAWRKFRTNWFSKLWLLPRTSQVRFCYGAPEIAQSHPPPRLPPIGPRPRPRRTQGVRRTQAGTIWSTLNPG